MSEIESIIFSSEMMETVIDESNNARPTVEEEDQYKATNWVRTKNKYQPSITVSVSKKLDPGVYTTNYDRDEGYYCEKLESPSDELFVFSDSVTEKLLNEIKLFWDKRDVYKAHKLIHKRGILLEGFPGTGKSSIVTQISEEVIKQGGVVFKVTSFRNLDDYVGFMRVGFRKIEPDTPVITIIEDIEKYDEVENQLLDFLDGKTNLDHHLIIATTNNTTKIPDTFLRPSRIDLRIEVPLPSEKTRREYFKAKKVNEELIEELVNKSENCSLADLKEIYSCVFVLEYSIEDALTKINTVKSKKNYTFNPKNKKIGLL